MVGSALCPWWGTRCETKCHQLWPTLPWALPGHPQVLFSSPSVKSHPPTCQEPVLGFHPRALKKVFSWAMRKEKRERKRREERRERQEKNQLHSNTSWVFHTCRMPDIVPDHSACVTSFRPHKSEGGQCYFSEAKLSFTVVKRLVHSHMLLRVITRTWS